MKQAFFTLACILIFSSQLFSQVTSCGKNSSGEEVLIYRYGSSERVILVVGGVLSSPKISERAIQSFIDRSINKSIDKNINKSSDSGEEGYSLWLIPGINSTTHRGSEVGLNSNQISIRYNFINQDTDIFYISKEIKNGKQFSEPETRLLEAVVSDIPDKENSVVFFMSGEGDCIISTEINKKSNLFNLIYRDSGYSYYDLCSNKNTLEYYISSRYNIPAFIVEFKSESSAENELNQIIELVKNKSSMQYQSPDFKKNFFKSRHLRGHADTFTDKISNNSREFIELMERVSSNEELLLFVNKEHFLDEIFRPDDLINYKQLIPSNKESMYLRAILKDDLLQMNSDAVNNGLYLTIISGFRSYDTQKITFEKWVKSFGYEKARMVSALPGSSQHQLGTAIDFNSLSESFENTKEGRWLLTNSYKYGFILSYPKGLENITGYNYEPWHYRYLGKDVAFIVNKYYDNVLELFLKWYWGNKKTI